MYWTRKHHVLLIEKLLKQLLGRKGTVKRLYQLLNASPMLRTAIRAADEEFETIQPLKKDAAAQQLSKELLDLPFERATRWFRETF